MSGFGIGALEVAPTVIWSDLNAVSSRDASAYRRWWERRGIKIVAMQSLLYGRPPHSIFGSRDEQRAALEYLSVVYRLASWLGAGRLVFGSPSHRRPGVLSAEDGFQRALGFFGKAGDAAAQRNLMLCLEPNPQEYGCEFINSAAEAREFIRRVASPGFALHLDAGAMTLQGEPPTAITAGELPVHFHISEPFLGPLGSSPTDHVGLSGALRAAAYHGFCSIETRSQPEIPLVDRLTKTFAYAIEQYRGAHLPDDMDRTVVPNDTGNSTNNP
jgi:D-psicose/D-tagatose/L-ribulose 3-epimerase